MISDYILKLYRNIENSVDIYIVKLILVSVAVFTVLANGMGVFNKFSVHDDVNNLFATGATFMSGRWMLGIIHFICMKFFGDFSNSLPVFNSLFVIIYLSIISYLVIKFLKIENKYNRIIICALFSVFPTVTSLFGYMFTMPNYLLGYVFAIIAVMLLCDRSLFKRIFGICFVVLALGIYQATVSFTIFLIVFYDIRLCLENKNNIKIRDLFTQMCMMIMSIVLYFYITSFFTWFSKTPLTNYQDINNMSHITLEVIFTRIINCYKTFFNLNLGYNFYYHNLFILYYIVLVLNCILLYINFRFKDLKTTFILILLVCLLPVVINFVYMIVGVEHIYSVMIYGQVSHFILFVLLLDMYITEKNFNRYFMSLLYIIIITVSLSFIRLDNQCYLKAIFNQQQAISYFDTLISRIKSIDGYKSDLPIYYINEDKKSTESLADIEELTFINIAPYYNINGYINSFSWRQFIKRWCGFDQPQIFESDSVDENVIKNMETYPNDGFIKINNGIIIVKF